MKYFFTFLLLVSMLLPGVVKAQIDTVIIEKYYVSDANDARETADGTLEEGSVTYRIFIKLAQGAKLKSIYGDQNHAIKIASSEIFYNNNRGKSFGKDINYLQLKRNTVALDTWLTLGLASGKHTGVLKSDDPDTSILGGSKNLDNMLKNYDPLAGIPIVQSDGLVVKDNQERAYSAFMDGVMFNTGEDTTIFGSIRPDSVFVSNDFKFFEANGNANGLNNKILVAQLTTKGDIRFQLNVEVLFENKTIKMVANNPQEGEVEVPFLTYPNIHIPVCGCPDPNYLEFNVNRERDSVDLCKTLIVLGCMDKNACNYSPAANVSDGLCCYPGQCANRDIRLVCPELGKNALEFTVFPNPAQNQINVEIKTGSENKTKCLIVDTYGRVVHEDDFGVITGSTVEDVDISNLPKGLYMVKIFRATENGSKVFMKN